MPTGTYIGRTPDGDRCYVEIRLEPVDRPEDFATIEHEAIPADALRFAVSGDLYEPGHREPVCCGQIVEAVRTVQPAVGSSWTPEDIASLCALWERWHLNDMRAGCAHQGTPSTRRNERYGYPEVDLDSVAPCELTGYRWGHAWLVELLPDDVIAEARRLMALAGQSVTL